jgi:DNA-binding response OmpR family regulator
MSEIKKNILIVDDDPDALELISMHVERFGFNAIKADSQKAGEAILEKQKPDLAILDLMMEKEDSGFILAYRLKQRYPDVPVIIATAVTKETGMVFGINYEEERKWIKADLYLEKNIRPDQLQREINRLLKL